MQPTHRIINIAKFLSADGRVLQLPAKNRTLLPVLSYVADKLPTGAHWSEREINELLAPWHRLDHPDSLRRHLIDRGLLARTPDGSAYWRTEVAGVPYLWRRR